MAVTLGIPRRLLYQKLHLLYMSQVKALEKRQLKMVSVFAMERAALWDIIMKQNQVMSSLCRKGKRTRA